MHWARRLVRHDSVGIPARIASAVSTRCPQGRSGNCRLLSDPAADARPPHGDQAFEVDREIFPRSAPAVRIGV